MVKHAECIHGALTAPSLWAQEAQGRIRQAKWGSDHYKIENTLYPCMWMARNPYQEWIMLPTTG